MFITQFSMGSLKFQKETLESNYKAILIFQSQVKKMLTCLPGESGSDGLIQLVIHNLNEHAEYNKIIKKITDDYFIRCERLLKTA